MVYRKVLSQGQFWANFVNDLFSLNTTGEIISCADNTAIFYESDTWQQLKEKVK